MDIEGYWVYLVVDNRGKWLSTELTIEGAHEAVKEHAKKRSIVYLYKAKLVDEYQVL